MTATCAVQNLERAVDIASGGALFEVVLVSGVKIDGLVWWHDIRA